MRYFAVIFSILAGCVTVGQQKSFPIYYITDDSPKEGKIYVVFKNEKKQDLCFYPTNWPGIDGRIDSGKNRVFITVDGKYYSTIDFDSGYCPACVTKVQAGQELRGFFNYKDFNLPSEAYSKEKSLKFSPMASDCSSSVND